MLTTSTLNCGGFMNYEYLDMTEKICHAQMLQTVSTIDNANSIGTIYFIYIHHTTLHQHQCIIKHTHTVFSLSFFSCVTVVDFSALEPVSDTNKVCKIRLSEGWWRTFTLTRTYTQDKLNVLQDQTAYERKLLFFLSHLASNLSHICRQNHNKMSDVY